jgi:hypothetical protein
LKNLNIPPPLSADNVSKHFGQSIKMEYESQYSVIKDKLIEHLEKKLKEKLEDYLQEEIRRSAGNESEDLLIYRAELN